MSSSDKSVSLRAWSEAVGKNMEMFKEATEMMVRDHQKSNVKTSSFAIHLQHMSTRETSLPIKAALASLSTRIDATETERLKVLAQLQSQIVNKFTKYPGEIKVANSHIQKRNVHVTEYAKAEKAYASAKASGNSEKLAVATGHLRMADEHMRSSEDVLNKALGDFEHMRVGEMKDWLKRYVRNQIFFHAKSIEGLTAAYQEVVKIDADTEKAVFLRRIREMEFNEVKRAQQQAHGGGLQQQQQQGPPALQQQQSLSQGQYQQQPLSSPQSNIAAGAPTPAMSPINQQR